MIKHKILQTHEEWLENRTKGIGGSDAGAVAGVSKWKSPYTLWCEKTGLISGYVPDNCYMRDGRMLEEIVAKLYTQETGQKVYKSNFSYQSEEHPFMLGNIDRWIKPGKIGLEIKTMDVRKQIDLDGGDIPPEYYTQCVHYMAVTGAEKWVICIWRFGQPLVIREILRDEDEINALIKMEEEFWKHVEDKSPVELDGSDSTAETLNKLYPEGQPIDVDLSPFDKEIELYLQMKQSKKELEKELKEVENHIKDFMQDAEKAHSDKAKVSWKNIVSRRLDSKKLKEDLPEIYEKYTKSSATRRFDIKEAKA